MKLLYSIWYNDHEYCIATFISFFIKSSYNFSIINSFQIDSYLLIDKIDNLFLSIDYTIIVL